MENKIVCKSNALIEASYKLSAQEQWIILFLTSMIKNNDEDFKEYSLSVKEFSRLARISHKGEYSEVKDITRKLIGRVFTINEPHGPLQVSWLSSARYQSGEGTVTLRFDPGLKPYLLQLKNRFTKYNLHLVMQMKSSFSIRIYELLKQYEKIGHRDFTLLELRERLGIESSEYPLYGNFKARILAVAQKEVKAKTDISFEFEEIKIGRSVGKIRFFIKSKTLEEAELAQAEVISTVSPQDPSLENLISLLPPDYREQESLRKLLKTWLEKKNFDYIARNIEYANDGSNAVKPGTSAGRGSNYRAYLSKALAGDFGLPYKEDNEAKMKVQAEAQQKAQEAAKAEQENQEQTEKEKEDYERARIFQESLSQDAIENLQAEAFSRLSPEYQDLVSKKTPGSNRLLKLMMNKIVLERMKIS